MTPQEPTRPRPATAREENAELLERLAPANTGLDARVHEVVTDALDQIESLPTLTTFVLGPRDEQGQIAQLTLVVRQENLSLSKMTTITANGRTGRLRVRIDDPRVPEDPQAVEASFTDLSVEALVAVLARLDGVGVVVGDNWVAAQSELLSGKTIADLRAVEIGGERYVRMRFTDGHTTTFHHRA